MDTPDRSVSIARSFDDALRGFVKRSTIYQGEARFPTIQSAAQTRLESLIEALINVASGFVISWLVWVFVAAPAFGIPVEWGTSFLLTSLFTVTSVARSYVWRRFFNASIHRRIHSWFAS